MKKAAEGGRRWKDSSGRLPGDGFGPWRPSRQLRPRGRNLKKGSAIISSSLLIAAEATALGPRSSINGEGNYYEAKSRFKKPEVITLPGRITADRNEGTSFVPRSSPGIASSRLELPLLPSYFIHISIDREGNRYGTKLDLRNLNR
ncbi:hypothetical protein KM043_005029 [Ampulex compressa]|nr:hypothetical protein KM043_005029 [Ampulex compressa]